MVVFMVEEATAPRELSFLRIKLSESMKVHIEF